MPLKTQQDEMPTLNLTPMIDVLFLLIIFFMCGTKFSESERKLGLQVPQVADAQSLAPAPAPLVINVYRDGRIALNKEFVSLDNLASRLSAARRQHPRMGVLVRGDAEGALQHVASVLNACQQAGVTDMGIAVQTAQKDRPSTR